MSTTAEAIADAVTQVTSPYQADSPHLGPSKIATYLRCPKAYHFQYILGTKVPASPAAALGTAIHRVVEQAHLSRWTHEQAHHAADLLLQMWEEVRGHTTDPDDPEAATNVQAAAQDWLPWYLHFKGGQIDIAVEQRWQVPIEHTNVMLEGTIDRLYRADGQAVLSDVKSGKRPPSAGDLATDLQVSLYWWGCQQQDLKPDYAEQVWLRRKDALRTTRTPEYLDAVIYDVVIPAARGIEAGIFPCNPASKYGCGFCGYQSQCAVGRVGIKEE